MGQEKWIQTISEGGFFLGLGYQRYFTPAGVELMWILFEDRHAEHVDLSPGVVKALSDTVETMTDFTIGVIDKNHFRVQYVGLLTRKEALKRLVRRIDSTVRDLIAQGVDVIAKPVTLEDIQGALAVGGDDGPMVVLAPERHWMHH